ncbi:MAG: ribose 5-phosphate isomerase A [Candidatus ainarchaeum sp.]|nr:ribose 5-phosphate isomerase A [Candidatus ainarchaeum sp.]
MSQEKINAAKKALEFVKDELIIGLGSGTTIHEFIKLLGKQVREQQLKIAAVPTSYDTQLLAMAQGIPLLQPEQTPFIDIAIDGADLVAKDYLIKGGGGALTREKIIAYEAKEFIVLADEDKLKRKSYPVPIEVVPFSAFFVARHLAKEGLRPELRLAQRRLGPIITDNGNFILDTDLKITNPKKLETELKLIPGVVETGIFTKFSKVIIGTKKGSRML